MTKEKEIATTTVLLPCPFCKNTFPKLIDQQEGLYRYAVYCSNRNCGATMALSSAIEFAINAWQRRDGVVQT